MKRKIIIAAAVLIVLALCTGLWYGRGAAPLTTEDTRMTGDGDFFTAAGQLGEDGTLRIEQTFYLKNRTGVMLEEIVLRLYANGSASCIVQPLAASVNGDAFDAVLDEDDLTIVRIARAWDENEEIDLTLWTDIKTDPDVKTAVIQLPVLALIQDGQWKTDAWDALAGMTCAPAMDGYLDIIYPQTLSAVFAGEMEYLGASAVSEAGVLSAVMHANGTRGMAFAVSKGGCVRWREIGGVAVSAMAENVLQANRLLDCAQTALESLEAIGLGYPFAALSVVEAQPISADGDVYSALIVTDMEADKETLIRRMTRLIARQTFGIQVGNDAWNAPWLSHTLASTAELLAFRQRKGEAAFEARFFDEIEVATRLTRPYGVTVGAGIDRFGGDGEMTQVLRDQGAAMMLGIEEAVGSEAFVKALNQYVSDNACGIADRQALEAALEAVTGSSWTGYLEDELAH